MAPVFYICTVAFITGIGIGTMYRPTLSLLVLAVIILTALALHARRTPSTSIHIGLLLAGMFVTLGLLRIEYAWSSVGHSVLETAVGKVVELEGIVVREPEVRERSRHLYVESGEDVLLVVTDRYETEANYGDRIKVVGTLIRPEAFATDLGRAFDYPGYLLARGVEYQVRYPTITWLAREVENPVASGLYSLKAFFVAALGKLIREPEQSLAVGLLLGIKQSLGEELEAVFRDSGIVHIVVLSGYNLMIVAGFVTLLLSYVAGLRVRIVIGIVVLLMFATMVGWSATVGRATIMAILALVALMLGRQYLVLRALCLAAALMLVHNPFLLVYDIGFQLSFLATLGLVAVAPRLEAAVLLGEWWQPVRQFLVATLAAQVAVLPLLLYHMGEVSLVAVMTNVLVLPVVPLAMLLSFLTGLVALFVPVVAVPLSYPTTAILWYIIEQARFWAGLPYATLPVPVFSFWYVAFAYAMLGFWWFRTQEVSRDTAVPVVLQNATHDQATIDLTGWTITTDVTSPTVRLKTKANAAPGDGAAWGEKESEVPIFFRPDSPR